MDANGHPYTHQYRNVQQAPSYDQGAQDRYHHHPNEQYTGPMVVIPQDAPTQYMTAHYQESYQNSRQRTPQYQHVHPPQHSQRVQFQEDLPAKQVYSQTQNQLYPQMQQYEQQYQQPQQYQPPQRPYIPQYDGTPIQPPPRPQKRSAPPPRQTPSQPQQAPSQARPEVKIQSHSQPRPPQTRTTPRPIVTPDLPVDYRLLLLHLSEQYVTEARSLSASIALHEDQENQGRYYQLMTMGMRCLETVLKNKNWSLAMPPRQEAMLQLRYATLLFEETEDGTELGELLSRGVTFCDRNKLVNLKYSMQHLCTRFLFKTNTKAGITYLDSVIKDATAYQHVGWVFAFRFLRVSLHMRLSTQHELQAALSDLKLIAELSRRRGEKALAVLTAILTAMMHLRTRDPEAATSAQTALATARAQQLDVTVNNVPQLQALILLIDLVCSLSPYNADASKEKMMAMQAYLDATTTMSNWTRDGCLSVPILQAGSEGTVLESGGIFIRDETGVYLQFTWLAKADVYSVGYLLSALQAYPKAHERDSKAAQFLEGGLGITGDAYEMSGTCSTDSLSQAFSRLRHCKLLRCYMLFQLALAKCARFDWNAALEVLEKLMDALELPGLSPPDDLLRFAVYLKGAIYQSLGQFPTAFACYQHTSLTLVPPNTSPTRFYTSPAHEFLAVLSALNTGLIICGPSHPNHNDFPTLLERLERHLLAQSENSNPTLSTVHPALAAALGLLQALRVSPYPLTSSSSAVQSPAPAPSYTDKGILPTKHHLQRSIHLAHAAHNNHLLSILMTLISAFFFRGQIGTQALSSANGSRSVAKNAGMRVWQAIAGEMLAVRFEGEQRWEEAERAWTEVESLGMRMPEGLWQE